jgi:hypothetical protein
MASTSVPGMHGWGNQCYSCCQALAYFLRGTEMVCGRLFYSVAWLLAKRTKSDSEGVLLVPLLHSDRRVGRLGGSSFKGGDVKHA